jgi:hypothetical protein
MLSDSKVPSTGGDLGEAFCEKSSTVAGAQPTPLRPKAKQVKKSNISIMKNNISSLHSYELPATAQPKRGTIFHPDNFLVIHNRLLELKPDAKRQWGKMNVIQMLNHLKIATGSGLEIYHLKDESSFMWRGLIKFIVLRILRRLPKNAKAAKGFKIEMNNELDFNTEKKQALNILEKAYSSSNSSFPHPLFGIMSRTEWGKLIYRHFDHHLRQFGA